MTTPKLFDPIGGAAAGLSKPTRSPLLAAAIDALHLLEHEDETFGDIAKEVQRQDVVDDLRAAITDAPSVARQDALASVRRDIKAGMLDKLLAARLELRQWHAAYYDGTGCTPSTATAAGLDEVIAALKEPQSAST